jgi:hypothetical protein
MHARDFLQARPSGDSERLAGGLADAAVFRAAASLVLSDLPGLDL